MDEKTNNNLLILGAGQYGTVVKEIAQQLGCFEKTDFLDDNCMQENSAYHENVVGKIGNFKRLAGKYTYAIVAIGNSELRRTLTGKLKEEGYKIPVLVSPKAYVSPSAKLCEGCIVEPFAGVNANAVVGAGTIISMGAIVNHNCTVMDYCHIDCGAIVESGAFVESGRKVEGGSVVKRETADNHNFLKI